MTPTIGYALHEENRSILTDPAIDAVEVTFERADDPLRLQRYLGDLEFDPATREVRAAADEAEILTLAVRFLHFALFEATLLSAHYYLVDLAVCLAFGFLGFRTTRAAQMVTQYRWINVRSSALSWCPREAKAGDGHADCG